MSKPYTGKYNVDNKMVSTNPVLDKLFENAGIKNEPEIKQNWQQIDEIYESIATGIVSVASEVNQAIRAINLLGVDSNAELAINVRSLTRDLETYSHDMVAIKERHKDFSGPVKDGEELALCLSVFEDYVALNDRFRANVFPVVITVTEFLAEAVSNNKEKVKETMASDLTNPNVVSDIEVKEKVNE